MPDGCRTTPAGLATVNLSTTTADGLPITRSGRTDTSGLVRLTTPVGPEPAQASIAVQGQGATLTGRVTLWPGTVLAIVAVLPERPASAGANSVSFAEPGTRDLFSSGWLIPAGLILVGLVGPIRIVRRTGRLTGWR